MDGELLSIIIPAYNEEKNVGELLSRVVAVSLPCAVGKEIIVVDDGSTDGTFAVASYFVKSHADVPIKLLRHERNQGKGTAIRTALKHVRGDYIIIQDADLELDPRDIAVLLGRMIERQLPVVYGSRFLGTGNTHLYCSYYFGGRLVSAVANLLYGQHITDEATCYKLFRSDVLRRISLRCRRFEFCPEVTAKVSKMGIKIEEIPIHYVPRTLSEGKKLRWRDGIEAILTLIKYRFTD